MQGNCAVILAACDGSGMKSKKPKVLAQVLYKPMIDWVIDSAAACGLHTENICVVTGHDREALCAHLPQNIATAAQTECPGTGHAILQTRNFLKNYAQGHVLILRGDVPLMDGDTVRAALDVHIRTDAALTVIGASVDDPTGYDRIVRDANGDLAAIVPDCDATVQPCEVHCGAYWFRCSALLTVLDRLQGDALTEAVSILRDSGQCVTVYTAPCADAALRADDRVTLAALNEIARMREIDRQRKNGVSIPFADGVILAPQVQIGRDTEILRGTILKGNTVIGEDAVIGPDTVLDNCTVGDGAELTSVYGMDAAVGAHTQIGPFVRLRPGTVVGTDARIGNFVEIKNSTVGNESKISHLSYIGDTDMGAQVNVGCGCATANFTGKSKHRTTIGDHAFIGCDTTLVAPVRVGERAYTGSGSVITEDIPDDALALGRARQIVKKDWVKVKKPYKE